MKNKLDDLLNRANALGLNKQTGGSTKENESTSWGQIKDAFSQRMEQSKEEKDVTKTQVSPHQEVSFPGLPTGKYTAADIFSGRGAPQPFVAPSEDYQIRTAEQRLADLRKAQEDLYTLEGPYGYLANDTVSPEKRAEYQARYDEILNQYGKDATSDSLREQMEQLEGELNASRDRLIAEQSNARIAQMTEEEKKALKNYAASLQGGIDAVPVFITRMDKDVKALFEKYGRENVDAMAETLKRSWNQETAQLYQNLGQKTGEALGFAGIPLGVGSGILGSAENIAGILRESVLGTSGFSTADPYGRGSWTSYFAQGIWAGGAKKAPEQMVDLLELMGNANPYSTEAANFNATPRNYKPQLYEATRGTKAGEVIDDVGSGAYQVVNTAVDTMARAYLGGGLFGAGTTGAKALSLGLAGARSFGDTFNDVSAKGGTPTQAAVLGVFNAGTEIATEYIPLEEWWKIAESGKAGVAEVLKAAAKQGAMEMTQEEIGFLATTMAEYAVLREKSEFQVLKRELIASGMTEEQAERAMWEEFGRQAAGVAVTSFFSGGLSTAGAQAFRSLMPGAVTTQQAEETTAESPAGEGAATPQSAPQTAPITQGGLDKGNVSEVGTVPEVETPLTLAQDYYRQNGTISNSMAEAILADNEALTELTKLTPVKLDGTKSQNRAEIRAAVARISGEAELSAEGQVQTMADAVGDAELRQTEQAIPTQEREADMPGAVAAAMRGEAYAAKVAEDTAPRSMTSQETAAMPEGSVAQEQTGLEEAEERKPAMGAADRGFTQGMDGPSEFGKPKTAKSKVYSNTYANATDEEIRASGKQARKEDRNIANYEVVTERQTLRGAQQRTATDEDIDAEYEILMREPMWSGEDNDTAMIVLKKLMQRGDTTRHRNLSLRQREMGTWGGQLVQSFAKYSRTDTETVTDETLKSLYDMGRAEVAKRFWKNADGENDGAKFDEWRDTVAKTIMRIGTQLEGIEDGDYESMRQIVKELAQFRRTTAGFGSKNELTRMADKGINKLDFESLKTVAKAQLGQIPNDFRKLTAAQVIKSISIMNMLSSLVTVNRNLVGNSSTGLMDAFSDSSAGRLVDVLLGKITGVRTVGNDIKHSREYFRGAQDAACMAAVCAELAIPIDDAEYTGATRTFSPQGNMLTRFLSGYEMGMKYALEVTDKFFEGGARASVKASLDELGQKSGLVDDEVDILAGKVGLRRTYKEGRAFAKASKGVKAGLNYLGKDGTGVGDVFMPFAGVPAEVAQVGVDYTAGVAEGLAQMIGIIKDAKAGETIDPARQRAAVTNFGRGISGTAMIAIFTALAKAGAIKVFDDEDRDKESLELSLGYSDAIWNLSASLRAITGQDTTWRGTDIKVSLGFLQPFNAQMYIAAELAEEDGFWNMVKAYPGAAVRGVAKSIMDIPMFGTFEDIANVFESFGRAGEDENAIADAVGQLVGNVGTRAIPSWLRQTAQFIDPNYRDTSADSTLGKAWNQIVAAIPGASKTLPMKYDGFGNPQLRYDNKVLGFFNTFISPGKFMGATAPESAYDMAAYLEQLAEITGDKSMYPDYAAPKSFSMGGEKVELSKEQQSEYQRVYGENVSDLYGQLMADEAFRKLPAEKQIEVLKSAKTLADDYAKAHTVGEGETSPGNLREAVDGLINSRISKDIAGAFDDLSETGYTGAAAQDAIGQMEAALDVYRGLSKDQKEAFLEGNSGRVASLIRATEKGMSVATFAELYGHYKDIEGNSLMSKKDQANAWGAYLYNQQKRGKITPAQVAQLREDVKIWQQIPMDPAKLDAMVEDGLGADTAMYAINLTDGLEPKEGNVEVTPAQKWAAIAGSDMTDAEMDIAIKAYMTDYNPDAKNPDRTELKYDAIRDMGFSPEQFVDMYEVYSNTSGKWKKIGALDAMPGVSNREAQLLYSIYSGDFFKEK